VDDPSLTELARRHHGLDNHVVVITAEQLMHARELITSGTVRELRLAVILLDHLVEVMLQRRLDYQIEQGDAHWIVRGRHYSGRERKGMRRVFDAKLDAILEYRDGINGLPQMLTASDVAILSISHAYRNDIYHRDTHNATLLPLLARLQLGAVSRTFARSFHRNVRSWGGRAREFRQRLAELGFDLAGEDDSFNAWEMAELCARTVTAGNNVKATDLRKALKADVAERQRLETEVLRALSTAGFPDDLLQRALFETELQAAHGEDDELFRLTDELASLEKQQVDRYRQGLSNDDSLTRERDKLLESRNRRTAALEANFVASAFDDTVRQALLDRFQRATKVPEILTAYRELDKQLRRTEECLLTVASEWERHLEMESDRLRGK